MKLHLRSTRMQQVTGDRYLEARKEKAVVESVELLGGQHRRQGVRSIQMQHIKHLDTNGKDQCEWRSRWGPCTAG